MVGLSRAPEIGRAGLQWLNVERPLGLEALRGRLVVLDFSTYCCVNCMHAFQTLNRLESVYPDEVVVIGVHSPKFEAERDIDNLRHALARHDIRHPVIHDPDMVLWDEFCVRAWPTLIFLAPDGHVLGQMAGEPDPCRLIAGVGGMLRAWRDEGRLKAGPLPLLPIEDDGGQLRFPGKIKPVAHLNGNGARWAVADSGHHQIALFDDAGAEVVRYGRGRPGLLDGCISCSAFRDPQGLACAPDGRIFVADTGNHAIRAILPDRKETVTLAGTGRRGTALSATPKPATDVDLASPWDLELAGDLLFFANAGSHQIGVLDLATGKVRSLAGSSAEDITDGPAAEARLAQPTGLALDAARSNLYFVDSESSALRVVRLGRDSTVETIVGTGLFDFGYADGALRDSLFQHPMGLAWSENALFVADTYNRALRTVDLGRGEVRPLHDELACLDGGEGSGCFAGEPTGIAVAGPDRLLVTDTNRHRILEVLPSRACVRPWTA